MQITYLSLNIWSGGTLFDNLLSFLKKENAGILALQEVYDGKNPLWERQFRSFHILQQELGFEYSSIAAHVIDLRHFGKVPQGNAIFSKFPIITEDVVFFDEPLGERSEETETDWSNWPCNLQHVIVGLGEKKLNVFNTHGPWGTHGGDTTRRLTMSGKIVEAIQGKEYVILSGDFNTRPNTKTIKQIEKYLINVFPSELPTTFNMKRKTDPGYATSVVDMLFVSKSIQVLQKECSNVDVSDHLPLVGKLAF